MPINKKSNFLDNKSNFLFSFIIRKFINQLMKNGKADLYDAGWNELFQ